MNASMNKVPKSNGIVMPLFAIAMLAMLGLAGLALDGGHTMLQNARLQNALDAAALAGAKSLSVTNGDTVQAQAQALATFLDNADNVGNSELNDSYNSGEMSVTMQFSNTLVNPGFVPGTVPARYIRVTANNFRVPGFLIPVLGFDDLPINSTAVAGPSPALTKFCNIAPMMACGDPHPDPNNPDPDYHFGYILGDPDVLKTGSTGGNFEVGPGNFQLIRLGDNTGGADIREAMAGSDASCVESSGPDIETEPGNTIGPVRQGLNTRFGQYGGGGMNSTDYPPDVNITGATDGMSGSIEYDPASDTIYYEDGPTSNCPPTSEAPFPCPLETEADLDDIDHDLYDHGEYFADINAANYTNHPDSGSPPGRYWRRTVALPIGDCSGTTNGQGDVPLLGVRCFHLLQPVGGTGNEAHVYGQFIGGGCGVTGNPGDESNDETGPFIIQLYKDPDANAT